MPPPFEYPYGAVAVVVQHWCYLKDYVYERYRRVDHGAEAENTRSEAGASVSNNASSDVAHTSTCEVVHAASLWPSVSCCS